MTGLMLSDAFCLGKLSLKAFEAQRSRKLSVSYSYSQIKHPDHAVRKQKVEAPVPCRPCPFRLWPSVPKFLAMVHQGLPLWAHNLVVKKADPMYPFYSNVIVHKGRDFVGLRGTWRGLRGTWKDFEDL